MELIFTKLFSIGEIQTNSHIYICYCWRLWDDSIWCHHYIFAWWPWWRNLHGSTRGFHVRRCQTKNDWLQKNLYGLHPTYWKWNEEFDKMFLTIDLCQSSVNLFIHFTKSPQKNYCSNLQAWWSYYQLQWQETQFYVSCYSRFIILFYWIILCTIGSFASFVLNKPNIYSKNSQRIWFLKCSSYTSSSWFKYCFSNGPQTWWLQTTIFILIICW